MPPSEMPNQWAEVSPAARSTVAASFAINGMLYGASGLSDCPEPRLSKAITFNRRESAGM